MTQNTTARRKLAIAASLAGAALLTAAAVGASAAGTAGSGALDLTKAPAASSSPSLVGNDKDYSITQTITNNTLAQTLTLTASSVDNGGTLVQSAATIAPGTSQTYVAKNVGNGVQLDLTFTTSGGDTVVVDTDVPEVIANWTKGSVTGVALGFSSIDVGSGNNPDATVALNDCSGNDCVRSFPSYFPWS